MVKLSKQHYTIALVLGVGVLCLVFAAIIINLLTSTHRSNEVSISNLDTLVKNISDDRKNDIVSGLNNIIKINNDNIDTSKIKDAVIRKESNQQSSSSGESRYTGTFIVDIPSLQQSYRLTYSYTRNRDDTFSSGYPVIASCLSEKEYIYQEFNCKNPTYTIEPEAHTALEGKLPYTSSFYTITSGSEDTGKPRLVIQIMMNHNSTATKKAFLQYSKDAVNWLKSQGADINNYTIEYRDLINQSVDLGNL